MDYESPQGRFKGQIDDSPRVTGLLSIHAGSSSLSTMLLFYLPRITTASHKD